MPYLYSPNPNPCSSPSPSPSPSRYVARLEIVNAVGELERVYFRFPEICLLVPDESKQEGDVGET